MDDALAVDHHVHLLHRQPVQPHGLDDLQALVHQGSRVDGDFCTHAPVGVFQGIGGGDGLQLLIGAAEEGTAGAGQQQPPDLIAVPAALETLENGAVLGVHGDDVRAAALRLGHDQLPGADQGLLIGQGDAFFLPDGGQGGLQAHAAHNGGDHGVGLGQLSRQQQALRPRLHPDVRVRQAQAQLPGGVPVVQHRQGGVKLPCLLLQQVHLAVGGQGRHGKAQLPGHLQGLAADGAGGAQQGNGFCHVAILLMPFMPPTPAAGRTAPGRQKARCRTGPARRRDPAADGHSP